MRALVWAGARALRVTAERLRWSASSAKELRRGRETPRACIAIPYIKEYQKLPPWSCGTGDVQIGGEAVTRGRAAPLPSLAFRMFSAASRARISSLSCGAVPPHGLLNGLPNGLLNGPQPLSAA